MGEGPTARLKLLGLDSGLFFPAQAPMPQSYEDASWQSSKDIGILEYVEWSPDMIGGPVRRVER